MPVTPYLFFNGNCAEAMRFYERTLGGKLEALMTFESAPAGEIPPEADLQRIMHAYLVFGDGSAIMASDEMPGAPNKGMSGFSISISYPSADEVKRVFDALSEGGEVVMPVNKTFWSEAFGMVVDRFGTPWMVSV